MTTSEKRPEPIRGTLDLYAEVVVLRDENDHLRDKVSALEAQVESLRDVIAVLSRET